jgi:hypothetical protein
MKYFTGIDVSLRFVSICVIDEAGIVDLHRRRTQQRELLRLHRTRSSRVRSVRFNRQAKNAGIEVLRLLDVANEHACGIEFHWLLQRCPLLRILAQLRMAATGR